MSDDEDKDVMEEMYWKYINPKWTDFDSSITCPECGSEDVDHSRGYRGEYECRACKKRWKAR